jgi:hypothetical protein
MLLLFLSHSTDINVHGLLLLAVRWAGFSLSVFGEARGARGGCQVVRAGILHLHARLLVLGFLDGVVDRGFVDTVHDSPIEDVIIVIAFFVQEVQEDLPKVGVVWLVFESQRAAVVKVVGKFSWKTSTNLLYRKSKLLFHDLLVFFLQDLNVKILPREGTVTEVHKDISN